jgi:hypothetical protein
MSKTNQINHQRLIIFISIILLLDDGAYSLLVDETVVSKGVKLLGSRR